MRGTRPVYLGVLLVELELPGVQSLKEKRSIILPITERLKARYPVSVARIDGLDALTWERIGVTAISADPVWLERVLEQVRSFVAGRGLRLAYSSVDIEAWESP